jgi:hypothetical protein
MSADTEELIERLDNYSMDWRDRAKDVKPVRDAIAGIRALLDRIASLENGIRECRTFVISCRAEAKGRNESRYTYTSELLGKIDAVIGEKS